MSPALLLVLAMLGGCIVMFAANRPRMDVVGLLVIAALPLTGIVTFQQAIAGFSDPNILLIALLGILGEGLVRTGAARRVGDQIARHAGDSEFRLLVLLMLAAAGLGAMMSSTAVVAIFIPVVLRICAATGRSPRMLMMPLSVAALCSGMLTLIATSPNLVVNAELLRQGAAGFGFFDFTPIGLPMLVLAILGMRAAQRVLARGGAVGRDAVARPSLQDWIARYDLPEREFRARVGAASPLIGATVAELGLRETGVNILAIDRARRFGSDLLRPDDDVAILAGDVLMLDVQARDMDPAALCARLHLDRMPLGEGGRYFSDRLQRIGMVEAIVPADSPLVGRTLLDVREHSDAGVTAIGLRRGDEALTETMLERKLRIGDTLLLCGFWPDIERLRAESHYLVPLGLPAEFDEVLPAPGLAWQAIGCLALTIALMVSGVVANAHAALIGCILLGALRCMDLPSAYRAIPWKALVLIVGMMPFSVALRETGGVELAADAVAAIGGGGAPRLALALVFAITALLGLFISNTAVAVLMAPVALAVAQELGAAPQPFAMMVALACSSAFMTPVSAPVNTLVMAPGGYGFLDFVRIGLPMALVSLAVATLLVPIVLPP